MLVVITPKEFWHHHEHALVHHENDNHQEEDCAVCQFTFSGFIKNHIQVVSLNPVFEQHVTPACHQLVLATPLIAHSGLAPPTLA